jgi:hypothetical protein
MDLQTMPESPYRADPLTGNHFILKRHLLKVVGSRFSIFAPGSDQVLFTADKKGFKLKEEIRVYRGTELSNPIFGIFARQIMDFSAAYDVVDISTNQKIGVFKRRGFKSMVRDEWILMDANDQEVGVMMEDSLLLGLLRRFVLNLIPQNYDLVVGGQRTIDLRQNFNPFSYHLNVEFQVPPQQMDRRLGLAGAILLASIEGRQQ